VQLSASMRLRLQVGRTSASKCIGALFTSHTGSTWREQREVISGNPQKVGSVVLGVLLP